MDIQLCSADKSIRTRWFEWGFAVGLAVTVGLRFDWPSVAFQGGKFRQGGNASATTSRLFLLIEKPTESLQGEAGFEHYWRGERVYHSLGTCSAL